MKRVCWLLHSAPLRPLQILARNGVDPNATPFVLTAKGLDPKVLPALRIQRATESELKRAAEAAWGEIISQRVRRLMSLEKCWNTRRR